MPRHIGRSLVETSRRERGLTDRGRETRGLVQGFSGESRGLCNPNNGIGESGVGTFGTAEIFKAERGARVGLQRRWESTCMRSHQTTVPRTSVQHRDTEFLRTGSPRPRIVLRGSQRILTLLTTGSEAMLLPRSSVHEHLNSLVGSWVLVERGGDGQRASSSQQPDLTFLVNNEDRG